jgi:hypothetical protein
MSMNKGIIQTLSTNYGSIVALDGRIYKIGMNDAQNLSARVKYGCVAEFLAFTNKDGRFAREIRVKASDPEFYGVITSVGSNYFTIKDVIDRQVYDIREKIGQENKHWPVSFRLHNNIPADIKVIESFPFGKSVGVAMDRFERYGHLISLNGNQKFFVHSGEVTLAPYTFTPRIYTARLVQFDQLGFHPENPIVATRVIPSADYAEQFITRELEGIVENFQPSNNPNKPSRGTFRTTQDTTVPFACGIWQNRLFKKGCKARFDVVEIGEHSWAFNKKSA